MLRAPRDLHVLTPSFPPRRSSDLLDTAAIDFARSLVAEGRPARPTRARSIPAITQEAFNAAVARLKRKTLGQDAPAACVASVKRAMTLPFDEAVEIGRAHV